MSFQNMSHKMFLFCFFYSFSHLVFLWISAGFIFGSGTVLVTFVIMNVPVPGEPCMGSRSTIIKETSMWKNECCFATFDALSLLINGRRCGGFFQVSHEHCVIPMTSLNLIEWRSGWPRGSKQKYDSKVYISKEKVKLLVFPSFCLSDAHSLFTSQFTTLTYVQFYLQFSGWSGFKNGI